MSGADLDEALDAPAEEVEADLWETCPIQALGHRDGKYYFSDPDGQFRELTARQFQANGLIDLFAGDLSWLMSNFEARSKAANAQPFYVPHAVAALIFACRQKGMLDPIGSLRGPGVWSEDEITTERSALIIHAGTAIGRVDPDVGYDDADVWRDPHPGQRIGTYIYPAAPSEPKPAIEEMTAREAAELRAFIQASWNWVEPKLASLMVIGEFAAHQVPGALPRRPCAWIRGERGSGKSHVLKLGNALVAGRGIMLSNATATHLREDKIKTGARSVMIDEFEQGQKNDGERELVELLRFAYEQGGGSWGRMGKAGQINAIFMAAAIQPPPLQPQDRSRHVVLQTKPLSATTESVAAFEAGFERFSKMGGALYRRMLDLWPCFMPAFKAYRMRMIQDGHEPRAADTYGTLFAAAELALSDEPMSDADRKKWTDLISVDHLDAVGASETNAGRCWAYLLSVRIPDWANGRKDPVGKLLDEAFRVEEEETNARGDLLRFGIRIVTGDAKPARKDHPRNECWLAIANSNHAGIVELFEKSDWAGGAHNEALLGLDCEPGVKRLPRGIRFGHSSPIRGVMVPVSYLDDPQSGHAPAVEIEQNPDLDEEIPF